MTKHWFITGASSGLGRHIAQLALSKGDTVTGTVRHLNALEDVQKAHGDRLVIERLDVTSKAEVAHAVQRTLDRARVDVVVNNAGGSLIGATEEMTDEQIQQQIALNLIAPIQITRAFLKPMREQGGGHIIQLSSVGGQVAYPMSSAYHAAKWGLEGFTEGVSQEVAEFGIHFTLVEPGGMRTGFQANLKYTDEIAAYKNGVVGKMRRWLAQAGDDVYIDDPAKLALAIFDAAHSPKPPLRLTLGPDAYDTIHEALNDRLKRLEGQEALARSVAFPL